MKKRSESMFNEAELAESLRRLDITELQERLELSPLAVDPTGPMRVVNPSETPSICCVCKIPDPFGGEDLPYMHELPQPTGPTRDGFLS